MPWYEDQIQSYPTMAHKIQKNVLSYTRRRNLILEIGSLMDNTNHIDYLLCVRVVY